MKKIKLLSWNVNGIRAVHRKDALKQVLKPNTYDIVCFQETKLSHPDQLPKDLLQVHGYYSYWHCATEKKGYSGTAIFSKKEPNDIRVDFGKKLLSEEGRMQQIEFDDFVLLNIYFPNGGRDTARLNYKFKFYKEFLEHVKKLKKDGKHIVFCGDVNTAHNPIDLARPEANIKRSGFMPKERAWLDKFIDAGFHDTFRMFNKKGENYTWWDMKTRARDRNVGWRIDYFYVSDSLKKKTKNGFIKPKIMGSDHCPVGIELHI